VDSPAERHLTTAGKLDLPPISAVQTRGPSALTDPYHHPAPHSVYMTTDRLPSLPLKPPGHAYSSGTSSPRVGSIASSNGSHIGSLSSFTSVASSNGPKTPSPTLPVHAISAAPTTIASYDAMNQGHTDMYYQHSISAGQPPPPQTVTSGLATYGSQLQSGHSHYGQNPYGQYGYANGLTSPSTAPQNSMSGPVLPLPGVASQNAMGGYPAAGNAAAGFDNTGQQPPPGMKPRVTATLWEDEGSLCFQVEARGICVARREDNHMINGTKLLNVAGMTRGRRDGILKSEKVRHVVKIGPMHLKGVWIPYDRALDFANKEKITELLYPLFVHNIGALLYHPTNQNRTNQVMAAAEKRKQEQSQLRNPPPGGLPSIQQYPHPMSLPGPQPPLPSHNNVGRPNLDRAHTFPTPPTSASSLMGPMGPSEPSFWQGQGMSGPQGANPMTVETGLNNTRSMPTTPATTPPGNSIQNMQSYSSGASQSYDSSRPMYNAPPSTQSPYQPPGSAPHDRMYSQASMYPKSEMAPPTNRPSISGPSGEQHDTKPPNGILSSEQPSQGHPGEEEGDHEHETEYTHDASAYDASRAPYNYTAPGVGALTGDNNIAPEMTGSPNHPAPSGRATPRTAAHPQPYYSQHTGYNTPPRVQQTSNSLYNVVANDRGSVNGGPGGDVYAPPADMASSMSNGYAPQGSIMNGPSGSLKRGRDDEDDIPRGPADGSGGMGPMDLKRRKTITEAPASTSPYDSMNRQAPPVGGAPRRR
jgi:protein SOK2